MNVLGLFSGIGGFELGFQRAGFNIAAMCEIEPYCRAVLAKHWPDVPVFDDVRRLRAADLPCPIDVITGGFPCQDISLAGKGAGLGGERSGLWSEYFRLIEEVRPAWVVIENVSALRSRGLDAVLGQLASIGYDAEWHCIPAAAVGAPHRRDRVWIIAYPSGSQLRQQPRWSGGQDGTSAPLVAEHGQAWTVADADCLRLQRTEPAGPAAGLRRRSADQGGALSDATRQLSHRTGAGAEQAGRAQLTDGGWWLVEPDVGRVANGVPRRVDRLRSLGNAVVPQIPEMIARAIMLNEVFGD